MHFDLIPGTKIAMMTAMFAKNIRQFSLPQLMGFVFLFAIAMGLMSTQQLAAFYLGLGLCAGASGIMLAGILFFLSDLMDSRPIDHRRLFSRLVNGMGLLVFLAAFAVALACITFGIVIALISVSKFFQPS